jgi:O-methyltransferase/methyltransferase family protein
MSERSLEARLDRPMDSQASPQVSTSEAGPQSLLDIAFAFRQAKVLLTAVELGLFTLLAEGPQDCATLVRRLALHGRGARDFFDALVAMRLLERDGEGRYANAPTCALFLDARKPAYIGSRIEYLNACAYGSWGHLTDALRSGAPQAGPFAAGGFSSYYAQRSSLEMFVKGMTGGSIAPARALARMFDWARYRTFIDIGSAQGGVPVELAEAHPHLTGGGFDLPSMEPMFNSYVEARGLSHRLAFHRGDFTRDSLPGADVLIMGRVLHDWDRGTTLRLLRKAWAALPSGGALIVWEAMIDDARRNHVQGLLSSLNMLLNTDAGEEFTRAECVAAMHDCGFSDLRVIPLDGAYTAVAGFRNDRGARRDNGE